MTKEYWVRRDGKTYGPVSGAKLKELAASGKVRQEDSVSADRESWQLAEEVRGLFPSPGERDEQSLQESDEHHRVAQPGSATAAKPPSVGASTRVSEQGARRVVSLKVWLILSIAMVTAGLVTTFVFWPGGYAEESAHASTDFAWTLGDAEDKAMEEIRAYLDGGGKIDGEYDGNRTPLQWACEKGYVRVAEYLLASGADVSIECAINVTPICSAAIWGHTPIVRLLLERGARPNAVSSSGWTPLRLAGRWGQVQTIQLLIAYGADPGQLGWSLAHRAVACSDITMLEELKDGDIDKTDRFHSTASQLAARNGRTDILEALLDRGADIHVRSEKYGGSLLSSAAYRGHPATVRMLLDRGLSVGMVDKRGRTALHLSTGNANVTMLLIRRGSRVDSKDNQGSTPLHCARTGPVARELIKAGADIDATDTNGRTPLHLAATFSRAVVEELLIAGADPNEKDRSGRTPLHSAELASTVDLLVRYGADPTARDDEGMRPGDVACNGSVGMAIERAYWGVLASRATSPEWPSHQRKLMEEAIKTGKARLFGSSAGTGWATGMLRIATEESTDPRVHALMNQAIADSESQSRRGQARIVAYTKESIKLIEQARSLKELRSLLEKRDRSEDVEHWEKSILGSP